MNKDFQVSGPYQRSMQHVSARAPWLEWDHRGTLILEPCVPIAAKPPQLKDIPETMTRIQYDLKHIPKLRTFGSSGLL